MEYEFPTEFNEYGINIKSPALQGLARSIIEGGGKLPPIFKGLGECEEGEFEPPVADYLKPFIRHHRKEDNMGLMSQFDPSIAREINHQNNMINNQQPMNTQVYQNQYAYQQPQYNYYNTQQQYAYGYPQQQFGYQQQYNYQQQQNMMGYNNTYPYQQQMQYPNQGYVGQPQATQYAYNPQQQNSYVYQQPQYNYYNTQQQYMYQQQPQNTQYGYYTQPQMQLPPEQFKNNGKKQLVYRCGKWYRVDGFDGPIPNPDPYEIQQGYFWNGQFMEKTEAQREKEMSMLHDYKLGHDFANPLPAEEMYDIPIDYTLPKQKPISEFTWDDVYNAKDNIDKYLAQAASMPHDESEEHFHDVMRKMYQEGKISLAQYTSVANGGIEYTTDSGVTVNKNNGFNNPFGFGGYYNQSYYEEQMKQQQLIAEHNYAMSIVQNMYNKYYAQPQQEQMSKEEIQYQNTVAQVQMEEDFNKFIRHRKYFKSDMRYNNFAAHVKSGTTSDTPGYISPLKEAYMTHYNKVWDERHKHIDPNMSFSTFMNGGGYADIVFEEMKYQEKAKMKKLVRLYDDMTTREAIHQQALFYDPVSGTSPKGFSINNGEIHIELPPELAAKQYEDRRNTFFSKIFAGRNAGVLPTDAEFFANQAMIQQQQMMMPQQQYMSQAPSPYMRM